MMLLIVFRVFVHEAVPKERVALYVRWNSIGVLTLHAFGWLSLLSESFSSLPLFALWLRALRCLGSFKLSEAVVSPPVASPLLDETLDLGNLRVWIYTLEAPQLGLLGGLIGLGYFGALSPRGHMITAIYFCASFLINTLRELGPTRRKQGFHRHCSPPVLVCFVLSGWIFFVLGLWAGTRRHRAGLARQKPHHPDADVPTEVARVRLVEPAALMEVEVEAESEAASEAEAAEAEQAEPLTISLADAQLTTRADETLTSIGGDTTCIVCFEGPKTHMAVPCGHQSLCGTCSASCPTCPYCRAEVMMWVQQRLV